MSLLDCPRPPPTPKSALRIHFGEDGRPVVRRTGAPEFVSYAERQRRAGECQRARQAYYREHGREVEEQVIPLTEDAITQYWLRQLVAEPKMETA